MSAILFVGSKNKLNNVYILNLNTYLGKDIIWRQNTEEACDIISNNLNLELIITYSSLQVSIVKKERIALELHKFLKEKELDIPIIIIGNNPMLDKFYLQLPEQVAVDELVRVTGETLKGGKETKESSEEEKVILEYYPIPAQYFLYIDDLTCDIFIRIKKSGEESQYVARFSGGSDCPKIEIQNYIMKGLTDFYIKASDRLRFIEAVGQEVLKKLDDPSYTEEENFEFASDALDVVSSEILTRGISKETITLAKVSMKTVSKSVERTPALHALLKQLLDSKTSYRYRHIHLITYISFHIINNMEWGSPQQQEKLAFAAFFHDISLTTDKLALINSEEDLNKKGANLSAKDLERVNRHAHATSEFLKKFPRVPFGAEDIIKQHHGTTSGIGFAKTFSNNLSPLSIVFIVAEEYVNILLSHKGDIDPMLIYSRINKKYPKFIYKRAAKTLKNVKL